jgi:hypothetical protein
MPRSTAGALTGGHDSPGTTTTLSSAATSNQITT